MKQPQPKGRKLVGPCSGSELRRNRKYRWAASAPTYNIGLSVSPTMSRGPAESPSGSERGSPPSKAGTQPTFGEGKLNVAGDASAVPVPARANTPASVQRMNCLVRPMGPRTFDLARLVISAPDIFCLRG